MVKIVLVGCGRQGLLHLRCLSKIRTRFDVHIAAVVDRSPERTSALIQRLPGLGFSTGTVAQGTSLAQLAKEIDLSDAIVDIVTTNNTHHDIAAVADAHQARGILIEKPLADTVENARLITHLDRPVHVVENYVFSTITRFAKDYLNEHGLRPCFAKTEFSKDRRLDSANGRGMVGGYTPHVFAVEIPHQIALAAYFLGPSVSVNDAWCHDMILPDGRLTNHGEGAITLNHGNGVTSYNFSCLQGHHHLSTTYRTARIFCDDLTKVLCYYPATIDLAGSVLIYHGNELVETHAFADDSLTEALVHVLSSCANGTPPIYDARLGCSVIEVIDHSQQVASEYR
jgi:predicted dehydrogenase